MTTTNRFRRVPSPAPRSAVAVYRIGTGGHSRELLALRATDAAAAALVDDLRRRWRGARIVSEPVTV